MCYHLRMNYSNKKVLFVYDFDNTLVETNGKIKITQSNGNKLVLSSCEYEDYEMNPADKIDISDFEKLVEPKELKLITNMLRKTIKEYGKDSNVILTRRNTPKPIEEFLNLFDIPNIRIIPAGLNAELTFRGNTKPGTKEKVQWLINEIKRNTYDIVEFIDDSQEEIQEVILSSKETPNTKIITRLVVNGKLKR